MPRDEQGAPSAPLILAHPQISLVGDVDSMMVEKFLDQLRGADGAGGDIALELTTLGGDPEMARRIVLEIEDARQRRGTRFLFLGKTVVYSAGITIMSGFPCSERWLSRDAMLMIHGRKLDKTVEVSGPMRASLPQVEALHAQIMTAIGLEEENFRRLVAGSDIGLDELLEKALGNWYLTAKEALERRLIAGVV